MSSISKKFADYQGSFYNEEINPKNFWNASIFEPLTRKLKRDIILMTSKPQVEESNTLICLVCNSRRISFVRRQMRSGDEPESVFFTCTSCGNNWRVG